MTLGVHLRDHTHISSVNRPGVWTWAREGEEGDMLCTVGAKNLNQVDRSFKFWEGFPFRRQMDAPTNGRSVVFRSSQPDRPSPWNDTLHEIVAQVELLCCHFAGKSVNEQQCVVSPRPPSNTAA